MHDELVKGIVLQVQFQFQVQVQVPESQVVVRFESHLAPWVEQHHCFFHL